MKNYAIILAAGSGERFGYVIPKQFVRISGKTVLEHTVEFFEEIHEIDEIIVVISPEYHLFFEEISKKNKYKKVTKILDGGNTRKESSYIGISSIKDSEANVIIHDGVRPFLSKRIISDCIKALKTYDAVDVAIKSADTIIEVDDNKIIKTIPNRSYIYRGQTPQCFKLSTIKKAHNFAKNDENFTDDCGLILKYKLGKVYVVEGEQKNIKITYLEDIFFADKLFQLKTSETPQNIDLKLLKDKVLVVFGGTSGIGKSIVKIAKKYKATTYAISSRTGCDVSNFIDVEKSLNKIYKENKRIDYVINSAGILNIGNLSDRSIEDIRREVDINYFGTINIVKSSLVYLKKTKGGILLFTSSSYTRGRASYSIYSSIKAAIVNLTQALSEEFITDNIRINVMNPERTATPMRLKAFGKEPKNTLCPPSVVAKSSLQTILSCFTGQTVNVRQIKNGN